MNEALSQFQKEIRHFSLVASMNLIVGASAIMAGMAYITAAVSGLTTSHISPELQVIAGVIAMVCFGLGVSVLSVTHGIVRGVRAIKNRLDAEGPAIEDDRITCLIVQMIAFYRNSKETLGTIILIGPLCGFCVFVLGIITALEAFAFTPGGFSFTMDNRITFLSQALTLAIVVSSLLSSHYFTLFATAWNHRIAEIEASECALKKTLGLDEE